MSYILYTGYVSNILQHKYADLNAKEFFDVWYENTRRYVENNIPIIILGPNCPEISDLKNVKILDTYDNLGHVSDYQENRRHGRWCGWTSAIVYGMIHAYIHNVDFVYKEQDCLAFGNYIRQMYNECDDCGIIYGKCEIMNAAQSLFLVKRDAIPDIISSLAKDDDKDVLPEYKFLRLPIKQKRLSFGYDRDRPFNPDDEIFYIQQVSKEDMSILKNKNLI